MSILDNTMLKCMQFSGFISVLALAAPARAEGFPQEAIDAWRSLEDSAITGRVVIESFSRKAGKETLNSRQEIIRDGDKIVWIDEEHFRNAPPSLVLRNDNGVFGLTKDTEENRWQLSLAEPLDSERATQVVHLDGIRAHLCGPISIFGSTLWRISHSTYVTVTRWETKPPSGSDEEYIEFEISVSTDDLENRIAAGEYKFVVDPNHAFRIVTADANYPGGVTFHADFHYDADLPNFFPSSRVNRLYYPSKGKHEGYVKTVAYTNEPPDPEVFELSYYGIEDVEFASEPSYWWLYALCGVVAAVCLSGYIVMRKRRE